MVHFFKKFSDLPDLTAKDKTSFKIQQDAFEDELDLQNDDRFAYCLLKDMMKPKLANIRKRLNVNGASKNKDADAEKSL
jgi:hypothetical protein